MMKIVEEFPPNIEEIKKYIEFGEDKPVFTYGDTIYNPFKGNIPKDLEVHEETHSKQQGSYPDIWWGKYLTDKSFRADQEVEAFVTQLAFLKGQDLPKGLIKVISEWMAFSLSSDLYGKILTYQEAESRIKRLAKTLQITQEKTIVINEVTPQDAVVVNDTSV